MSQELYQSMPSLHPLRFIEPRHRRTDLENQTNLDLNFHEDPFGNHLLFLFV